MSGISKNVALGVTNWKIFKQQILDNPLTFETRHGNMNMLLETSSKYQRERMEHNMKAIVANYFNNNRFGRNFCNKGYVYCAAFRIS